MGGCIALQSTSCEIHQRPFPFAKAFWSAYASSCRFWERGLLELLMLLAQREYSRDSRGLLASRREKCFQFDLTGEALALDAAVVWASFSHQVSRSAWLSALAKPVTR